MAARSQMHQVIEGHKLWKENNACLYDLVVTHALEWPSLTVEWLPDYEEPPGKNYSLQRLILGTSVPEGECSYLIVAQFQLPLGDHNGDITEADLMRNKVQIIQQIVHFGDVNRARYMPQDPSFIATRSGNNEAFIFNLNDYPPKARADNICDPNLKLSGLNSEGYGLSWSLYNEGFLLSCSYGSQICLWDINRSAKDNVLEAQHIFEGHEGSVQDVSWHLKHSALLGSVGNDHCMLIWDLRRPPSSRPTHTVAAHQDAVNCLAFSPFDDRLVATGSDDTTVKLFDLRKTDNAVHTFDGHKEKILQIQWNPNNETVLASSCSGSKLNVWDISRIGKDQDPKDAEEGPPELLFLHGGHMDSITDFSWNPCDDWVLASVALDNIIQLWEMGDHISKEVTDPRNTDKQSGR